MCNNYCSPSKYCFSKTLNCLFSSCRVSFSLSKASLSSNTYMYTQHDELVWSVWSVYVISTTNTAQTITKPLPSILDETISNATTLVHPTNTCSNYSITSSSTGVLNSSCVLTESHTDNDNGGGMSTPTIIIIVLVIAFATIFTFGMMIITVCALYIVVVFFKKKRENVEVEMLSCRKLNTCY